jgi:hypothetical protein
LETEREGAWWLGGEDGGGAVRSLIVVVRLRTEVESGRRTVASMGIYACAAHAACRLASAAAYSQQHCWGGSLANVIVGDAHAIARGIVEPEAMARAEQDYGLPEVRMRLGRRRMALVRQRPIGARVRGVMERMQGRLERRRRKIGAVFEA